MAFIDTATDCLCVRIVFDGPAEAGKTATVEALAESFGERVVTPGERDRRTLFFDWVEHTAGRFGGRPIRCQLVTVPGQRALSERREEILSTADAVVFVVDSRRSEFARAEESLRSSLEVLTRSDLPCEWLVQANKRDCRDVVSVDEIASLVGGGGAVRIVETTASSGDGVREVFIHAVRLALARVRALDGAGRLDAAVDAAAPAQVLYDRVAALSEVSSPGRGDWSEVADRADAETSPFARLDPGDEASTPFVDDPLRNVREGAVWPAIEGRMYLSDAATDEIHWQEEGGSRTLGVGRRWLFETTDARSFDDFESARLGLLDWARRHMECRNVLTFDRCLVVLPTREGRWQLWQIVGRHSSVRDQLEKADWSGADISEAAAALSLYRGHFLAMIGPLERCRQPLALHLGGLNADEGPPFVGLFELDSDPGRDPRRTLHLEFLQHFDRLCARYGDEELLRAIEELRRERSTAVAPA